ncbi:hypothetical protein EIP91_012441 [Steccherinum ochraceum]|uniref:BTB domain-containing protein n=1 Tax=Steccherinum ochraceum TaxID=92696 RepID=A0A4R0RIW4_9APHY|nr:hypothetical protein EIP91_012441 [Steccherinum ochraceum]
MADPQAPGPVNAPTVQDAPPPFDRPTSDVIFRTVDHVDFRVHKTILIESSPFFQEMFASNALVAAAHRHGLPVVHVSESSRTLNNLLRFCYPTANPELGTAEEICEALDASRKYMMDSAEQEIVKQFACHAPKDPVALFALSSHHFGWEKELRVAAKECLRLPFDSSNPVLQNTEGSWYKCLHIYHQRCCAKAGSLMLKTKDMGGFGSKDCLSTCTMDDEQFEAVVLLLKLTKHDRFRAEPVPESTIDLEVISTTYTDDGRTWIRSAI